MYQIRLNDVDNYIKLVTEKVKLIYSLIQEKQNYMNNKLKWNSQAGSSFKKIYQKEINQQIAYCDSIEKITELYKMGLEGFSMSSKTINKNFQELKEENKKILGDINEYKY